MGHFSACSRRAQPRPGDWPRDARRRRSPRWIGEQRRALVHRRTAARQGPTRPIGGRARWSGNGGGSFPAGTRLGTAAGRAVVGTTRRHQPRADVTHPRPEQRGASCSCQSTIDYRGLRDRRFQSSEGPACRFRASGACLKRYTRPPFRSINAPRSAPRFGGPRLAWREGKDSHKQAVCV